MTKAFPLTSRGVRTHLKFNTTMTALEYPTTDVQRNNVNSTMLGGQVLYPGDVSDGAFRPDLLTIVAGIDPSLTDEVDSIFAASLDLDTTPVLSACTQLSGGESWADAFSVGVLFSGTQIVTP